MGVTTEIGRYLRSSEFRDRLVRQYVNLEILAEAGLRTAVVNLLRAKIRAIGDAAKGYRVSCEPHLDLAGVRVVPDVLIWKNKHPRIWIELKDTKRFDSAKAQSDWEKLQNSGKHCCSLKAGYLIYVARFDSRDLAIKRTNQTRRYWLIKIALKQHIRNFEAQWEKEYTWRAHYKVAKQKTRAAVA